MVCLFVWYVGSVGRLVCMIGRLVLCVCVGLCGRWILYGRLVCMVCLVCLFVWYVGFVGRLVCMVGWFLWCVCLYGMLAL